MSAMSANASTTTHFAQFLKVKSKATCNNLISKRRISIIEECKSLLMEYRKVGLRSKERQENFACYNLHRPCFITLCIINEIYSKEAAMSNLTFEHYIFHQ